MPKELRINGVIGHEATLETVRAQIADAGITPQDEVLIKISSPGGSVLVGFEIYNEIKELPAAKKTFQINGIAASIATLIVLAGDEIEASEFSLSMIHKASTFAEGNADQLAAQIEILNKINELLIEAYYDRNQKKGAKKLTRDKLEAMMDSETWFTPEEAVGYGFADRIVNRMSDVTKIAALTNKFDMNHLARLRRLIASGGRVEITLDLTRNAVTKALGGKQYTNLNDEEVNTLLIAVREQLVAVIGGALTDEEMATVNGQLETIVGELKEKETANSTDGKLAALTGEIAGLRDMLKEMGAAIIKNGQDVENLQSDLTATQKGIRSFGRKPFVNEASRLNIGSAYVDPHAKHRQEMAEIDKKTRAAK